MSKTEQPIKFIYATRFDSDNLTFTTRRLNVVKECSRYVSLEDGSRIETSDIYDLYTDGYRCRSIEYALSREDNVYSLKPISKDLKTLVKKEVIESLKASIESDKRWLADRESSVKELKEKIAEQEAKLARLLKL